MFVSISGGHPTTYCQSKKELRLLAEQSASYFIEITQIVKNIILENDKAAVEIDYIAVLKKNLSNGMKSGQELNLCGISIFIFRNEKIFKLTDYS